jgi:hypothetical protein
MKLIHKIFYDVSRTDEFVIVPLFDIHIGHRDCNEAALKRVVDTIANTPNMYWIGGGDFCDFIRVHDPRFSPEAYADWIQVKHLGDVARAQRDRFLDIIEPIAPKCLGLLMGNHEETIHRYSERRIYDEIVMGVKERAGFPAEQPLALGYSGFLWLDFVVSKEGAKRESVHGIVFDLHHGHVGGRLKGAKGLNLQREMWYSRGDIMLRGHSHNTDAQTEAVIIPKRRSIETKMVFGAYCGCFLESVSKDGVNYAERAKYPPVPLAGIEVVLSPRSSNPRKRIRVDVVAR